MQYADRLTTSQNVTAPKPKLHDKMFWHAFDYQSECHCSKTVTDNGTAEEWFDYQSECHCSKTQV